MIYLKINTLFFILLFLIIIFSIGVIPKTEKCDKYLNPRAKKISRVRNVELNL